MGKQLDLLCWCCDWRIATQIYKDWRVCATCRAAIVEAYGEPRKKRRVASANV
jgi:hypothetical protein